MAASVFKTRTQLAGELGISRSTLHRWLKKENIELPKGRFLRPEEYKWVLDCFGCKDK